ncbi:unnamed protein product [Linum trigynum]|uniref:Uncharacterized protein n=1 Tax=Linum trigynum TaxID=586398 RepID=A0AAV2CQS8_9ROSI
MSPDLASRGRESRHVKSLHGIRSGIERQIESDSSYFPIKSRIGFWVLHSSDGEGGRGVEKGGGWVSTNEPTKNTALSVSTAISRSGDVSDTL